MAKSFRSFALFFFLVVLVAALEMMPIAEAKLCEKRSKTWSGICANSGNCNRQCKNWEDAFSGACHRQGIGFACFCYFKC